MKIRMYKFKRFFVLTVCISGIFFNAAAKLAQAKPASASLVNKERDSKIDISDIVVLSHPDKRVVIHWTVSKHSDPGQILVLRRDLHAQDDFTVIAALDASQLTFSIKNHPAGEFQFIVKSTNDNIEQNHTVHRVTVVSPR